jgi:AraC-like DNA-binding protein
MVPIHQTLFRQSTASVLDVRKDASEIVSMKREEWKDETILMLTLRGNGILTHKGRRRMLSAGRAFIGIGMEDSTHGPDPDFPMAWETAWIRFPGLLAIDLWGKLRNITGPVLPLPLESPAGLQFMKLAERTAQRRFLDEYEASSVAYAFFMTLQKQVLKPLARGENSFRSTISFMLRNFKEPFTINELARRANLSREHFSRLFLERRGSRPAIFLRNLRLDHARKLMNSTSLSLRQLAIESGFRNLRQFKYAYRERYHEWPQRINE